METYLVTVGFFGVLMLMMAVGVIFGSKPLKGSCGGVGNSCPCDEAGTPGACKTDLEADPEPKMSMSDGEDGLVHYT